MNRRAVAALAVFGALAGCADLFGFKQLTEGDAGPDVFAPETGADASDAGDASDEPDAAACVPVVWPGPPGSGPGGDAGTYTLAMRHVHFTTNQDGGVGSFGYDLDDHCTTSKATASCKAAGLVLDAPGGLDNESIQLLNILINNQQAVADSLGDNAIDVNIDEGGFTMLLRMYGLKSDVNQPLVQGLTVALQSSPGLANADAGAVTTWDGTDVWNVSADDVAGGLDAGTNAPLKLISAYVAGGVLVAIDPGPVTLTLRLPPGNTLTGVLPIRLTQLVLTGTLVKRGDSNYDITGGTLAGRWATVDALDAIASLELAGGALCDTLSGQVYTSVLNSVCPARDISSTGVDDGTASCDAVSVAMSYDAVASAVANKPTATPVTTTPCADAGQCN